MGEAEENKIVNLRLDDIIPNRFQPREIFDETGLQELSDSIKEHGVIQPIVVRPLGNKYELIAGERRTKASALAGLTTIPAIIKNMDDKESAKVSLLENLQRKNLSAIEEARTYKRIIELDNMTQEELARTMGRSQPMIANKLRLLSLPEEVQEALMKNQISERHARSLLTLKNKKNQLFFLDRIKNERLTVRELDSELKKYKENKEEIPDSDLDLKENKEEDLKNENSERSFMNNNRGNFGGMGLNDYQSSVNNNMFNNIPNNFNNIQNTNTYNNQDVNYNNFDIQQEENKEPVMNEYLNNIATNNNQQPNQNNTSSLAAMLDGDNGTQINIPNTTDDSNLFISHIREDNLPKVDNQFLPNFDNFNQNNTNNSYDYSNDAINNFNQNNANNSYDYSNDAINNFSQNNANNSYDYSNDAINNFNQNNSFNDLNNLGQNPYNMNNQNNYDMLNNNSSNMNYYSETNPYQNNNVNYMNDNFNDMSQNNIAPEYNMNQGINEYNSNFNNNSSMNKNYFMNDLNNNVNNGMGSNINSNINNMYQPNQGAMFEQPLNIIDVPGNNVAETQSNNLNEEENKNSPIESESINKPISTLNNINQNTIGQEFNEEYKNYSLPGEDVDTNLSLNNENKEEFENKDTYSDNSESDSMTKDETETNNNSLEETQKLEEQTELPKDEYIRLDPEYTIKTTMDAINELKKTTDVIKANKIDIETEEIDFGDIYQITIKIRKEETDII